MSGHPLPGGCRGLHVLKLLKALSPVLEPSLVGMWDTVIPKLTLYLEGRGKRNVFLNHLRTSCKYRKIYIFSFHSICPLVLAKVLDLAHVLSPCYETSLRQQEAADHCLIIIIIRSLISLGF